MLHTTRQKRDGQNPKTRLAFGFTLIETFVAVSILVFAIAGPMKLVSDALFAGLRAKDQLTATYFAQRTIEGVRNLRDRALQSGGDMDNWFSDCFDGARCVFDPGQEELENKAMACSEFGLPNGECPLLRFHDDTGAYGYETDEGWTESKFRAYFTVGEVQGNPRELRIIATTEFEAGFTTKEVEIVDRFLAWQ